MEEVCVLLMLEELQEKIQPITNKNSISQCVKLETFPYLLFSPVPMSTTFIQHDTIRVRHSFVMSRKEFVQKLRPLLRFCEFDEFTEMWYDDPMGILMQRNCWIKKVLTKSGKDFYSIKTTAVKNYESSCIITNPEIETDIEEMKTKVGNHEVFDLFYMLENMACLLKDYFIQIKVHRTKFEFKGNPNIKLNVDRGSFDKDSGYVVYSLFGDVPSSSIEIISNIETIGYNNEFPFKEYMKPSRSKIIQYLFEKKQHTYYILQDKQFIPKLDYQTISLLQYESQRIRLKWEDYNSNVTEDMQKSKEFIDYMEEAALKGNASITYEDEEGNSHPYYSDDEEDEWQYSLL